MNSIFIKSIISLALTTFIPGLELRASIPLGFITEEIRNALGIPGIVLVCFVVNVIVGLLTFSLMKPVEFVFRKWGWFDRHIWPLLESKREKLRPLVVKYGVWGVAVFIGVPLPGTGAYAGAVGAYLLALDRRRFWLANLIGVAVACAAVTAICMLVEMGAELGFVRGLFLKEG